MTPPDKFPTVQTDRLFLRELIGADAPALLVIHGDAELMRLFGNDPIPDLASAEAGLFGWNRAWRKCTVGYELAQTAQGKGYMHEALTAALSWGFEEMSVNRIEAQVHPDNGPSLKLLRRLRFVEEGRLRQGGYWAGQYQIGGSD